MKQRQEERAWREQQRSEEIERRIDAMPEEEREALVASAMTKLRAGLRANYHRLKPEVRQIADRLGVMDDE